MAIGATIPSILIQRLIPLLMKQTEQLNKFVSSFADRIMQLNSKTNCSDPSVKQLKVDFEKILQQIDLIKQGLNTINSLIPVIRRVSTVARTLKTIQLAIPAITGVPSGPITELINTFDNLGTNAKSATNSLQGLIDSINTRLDTANNTLAVGINKLASICNTETFNVTKDIANELNSANRNINNNTYVNNSNSIISSLNTGAENDSDIFDSIAPTRFYTELNVSNDDIQNRIQIIRDLIEQQVNVLQNLKEAPSKVLSNSKPPTLDIGDIDDYYIDTRNQIIYGPKTNIGWGTGIEI